MRYLLAITLLILLLSIPGTGRGEEILNTITIEPPFNVYLGDTDVWDSAQGNPGYWVVEAEATPGGMAHQQANCGIASAFPSGGGFISLSASTALGHHAFDCILTGNYRIEIYYSVKGMASVYVPREMDVWGNQFASTEVFLRIVVNRVLSDDPLILWPLYHLDYPLIYRESTFTGSEPVVVEFDHQQNWLHPSVFFENGCRYRIDMNLRCSTLVNTWGSGQANACAVFQPFEEFNWLDQVFDGSQWHGQLYSLTVSSTPLDLTPPVTIPDPPGDQLLCPGNDVVTLTAVDSDGYGGPGYGVETTYWRHDLEDWQIYDGGGIPIVRDLALGFYSVDRVGNVEAIRTASYTVWSTDGPLLTAPADGETGLDQPLLLSWEAVGHADDYHVLVDDDAGFASPEIDIHTAMPELAVDGLAEETPYFWRVEAWNETCESWGEWSAVWSFQIDDLTDADNPKLPDRYSLGQNFPNPFNPLTTIAYDLPGPARVTLRVFDLDGRAVSLLLSREDQAAGSYRVDWSGRDDRGRQLPSGTYLYRLEAGDYTATRRMTIVR